MGVVHELHPRMGTTCLATQGPHEIPRPGRVDRNAGALEVMHDGFDLGTNITFPFAHNESRRHGASKLRWSTSAAAKLTGVNA
jgi:hypothetical protein